MTLAHGTEQIESDRLIIRRIAASDADFYVRIHADPIVARYLGHGRPRSTEESLAWLQAVFDSYEELLLGPLAVIRKSDGLLIGRCGLNDVAVEASPATGTVPRAWFGRAQAPADVPLLFEPELGYTFDTSSWGHGYATEAARCVSDYVRDVRRLPRVISLIHPENVRSLRVAQKFSLRRDDPVEMQAQVLERFVWPRADSA